MQPAIALLLAEGGFDPFDFSAWSESIWTWVIFVVSMPLMWKFVFGPIVRALNERDQKAEDAVKAAKEAQAAAEKAKTECDAQLADVKAEGARIVAEAQSRAEAQGKEILEQSKAEAAKTMERARAEIEREKLKALFEIREEVVDLSLGAAEKVVGRKFDDKDARRLVEETISSAAKQE